MPIRIYFADEIKAKTEGDVRAAVAHIEANTCIKFKFHKPEYLRTGSKSLTPMTRGVRLIADWHRIVGWRNISKATCGVPTAALPRAGIARADEN